MNYNEFNKSVGESKPAKVFGLIFLIAGIIVFITFFSSYLNWKLKEGNYSKQYVYSSYGNLYYELKDDIINVEKIYDTNDEIIKLDVPDQKTVIMYCSKDNNGECIYFDINNSIDQGILHPFLIIIVILLLIAIGLFFAINTRTKANENESSLSSIYMFYVFLFVLGLSALIIQIYDIVNYLNLKNANNVTTATVYSEIYSIGGDKDLYKPVFYYYVDDQRYIYINDSYIKGSLDDNLGQTIDLYYNKNDPEKAITKENPVNFLIIIIGLSFTVLSFPFIFFKGKMEKRIDRALLKQEDQDWKI